VAAGAASCATAGADASQTSASTPPPTRRDVTIERSCHRSASNLSLASEPIDRSFTGLAAR
jgi:hypothetical protein